MSKAYEKLEYSDFNTYPHYVFATAFLINGKLADYKIGNRERSWSDRTFRGLSWERELFENGKLKKEYELDCAYHSIKVNNNEEHNLAFNELEDWLQDNFETYNGMNLFLRR